MNATSGKSRRRCVVRKREAISAKKLNPNKPVLVSQTALDPARLTTGNDFEPVSWLALVGTLIGIYLTVAFPSFDPLAALLGQFP
jgi:hypothetical protein